MSCLAGMAQLPGVSEEEAVALALQHHPQVLASQATVNQQQALRGSTVNITNLEIYTEAPSGFFYAPGLTQNLLFPGVYLRQGAVQRTQVGVAKAELALNKNQLAYQTRYSYQLVQYWQARLRLLAAQDTVLADFVRVARLRYQVGQTKYLERLNGEARYGALQQQLRLAQTSAVASQRQLALLLGSPALPIVDTLPRLAPLESAEDTTALADNPSFTVYQRNYDLSREYFRLERAKAYPSFYVGYFNQGPTPENPVHYNFRLGMGVPLWFWQYRSRMQGARLGIEVARQQYRAEKLRLGNAYQQALANYLQALQGLNYYDSYGLAQARELLATARASYRLGETNYYLFLQSVEQAFQLQNGYLDALQAYNNAILYLNYLRGNS